MKNHLLLYFLLFILTEYGFAQTYIKPIIGRDFTKLENTLSRIITNEHGHSTTRDYSISKKGFKFNSTLFGLKVESQLSPKYSIALTSTYTKKEVNASFFGFLQLTGYSFNYFRSQLNLNYKINDFVFIGLGGNANVMTNFRYILDDEPYGDLGYLLKEFGINGVAGIHFKNIELELYYIHNLTTHEEDDGLNLKPIQSFGATFGYKIRL